MLILTGPTAAGKNSVAKLLAQQRERCAVIDFDVVRHMFVNPHRAPWQGDEGKAQQLLGVQLVSSLAEGFAGAGWKVIIVDVLSDETIDQYQRLLNRFNPRIVQLLPSFAELKRRFVERDPCLTDDEFKMVYEQQCAFTQYDLRIDNTALSAEQVAEQTFDLV